MYCPKCGKANPEGARFCMHCGVDLNGHKVEFSPNINVSPKVSAYAKAEGVPYPKWKPKVEEYVKIKGEKLPVYSRFAEYSGKPFCPLCRGYDSLEKEPILKTRHVNSKSVTIVKYDVYRCLACGKKALICKDREKYTIPSEVGSGYYWIDGIGKIPIFQAKPEICPKCKIPNTVEYAKKAYFPISYDTIKSYERPSVLDLIPVEVRYYKIHGYEYSRYRCFSCGWSFLIKESTKKEYLTSVDSLNKKSSDIWNKDEVVKGLCQYCGEKPATLKNILEYAYKCEVCGKVLCRSCVNIGSKYYYCPTCASLRICSVCGKYIGEFICSSCGRRICKNCAHGILSKKCPNCK